MRYSVNKIEDSLYYEVIRLTASSLGEMLRIPEFKGTLEECAAYISLKTNPAVLF